VNVHQLLSGAGPVDAVTNQAREYRRLFGRWGWGGGDHAVHIDPRAGDGFAPLERLDPGPDDVLLVHYSAYAPRLAQQLERPQRKLLVSHNITPAEWFWRYEPMTAVQCAVGREQLPRFAAGVDLAAGVSEFNVAELAAAGARETAVIPIVFDAARWGAAGEGDPPSPPTVLFVGRISPHKRHDLLVRAFALYRRERAADARLVLVGEPLTPAYGEAVAAMAERLAPGAVTIESLLGEAELAARWRSAHAFACLSEHEGFCIPLLEAFHFGVPVIARAAGGVPEVAGDAALLLDDADPALVAELIHLAVADAELRAELRRRGRARLARYAYDETAQALRSAVERVAVS
jgi:glycosyltransferase involved in cell wall biosynthesis